MELSGYLQMQNRSLTIIPGALTHLDLPIQEAEHWQQTKWSTTLPGNNTHLLGLRVGNIAINSGTRASPLLPILDGCFQGKIGSQLDAVQGYTSYRTGAVAFSKPLLRQ